MAFVQMCRWPLDHGDKVTQRGVAMVEEPTSAQTLLGETQQLAGEAHASAEAGQIEKARFVASTAADPLDAAVTVLEEQGSDSVEGSVALASTGIEVWISGFGFWGETATAMPPRSTAPPLVGAMTSSTGRCASERWPPITKLPST